MDRENMFNNNKKDRERKKTTTISLSERIKTSNSDIKKSERCSSGRSPDCMTITGTPNGNQIESKSSRIGQASKNRKKVCVGREDVKQKETKEIEREKAPRNATSMVPSQANVFSSSK